MLIIMQEINALFVKLYVLSKRSKCAHKRLPGSLARDEGVISIIRMYLGVTGKFWFLWLFDRYLHH